MPRLAFSFLPYVLRRDLTARIRILPCQVDSQCCPRLHLPYSGRLPWLPTEITVLRFPWLVLTNRFGTTPCQVMAAHRCVLCWHETLEQRLRQREPGRLCILRNLNLWPSPLCAVPRSQERREIRHCFHWYVSSPLSLGLLNNHEARNLTWRALPRCSFRHWYIVPSRRTFRSLRYSPGLSKVEPLVRCYHLRIGHLHNTLNM